MATVPTTAIRDCVADLTAAAVQAFKATGRAMPEAWVDEPEAERAVLDHILASLPQLQKSLLSVGFPGTPLERAAFDLARIAKRQRELCEAHESFAER